MALRHALDTTDERTRTIARDLRKLQQVSATTGNANTGGDSGIDMSIPDSVPRWVTFTVPHTHPSLAADGTGTVTLTIGTLPPGTVWTAVSLDVPTLFTGGTISAASLTLDAPAGSALIFGSLKTLDLFTAPALDQRGASQFCRCDPNASTDVQITITLTGGVGADLTAGMLQVHLLASVPGSSAEVLP
jgi:hypothetical protein